MLSFFFPANMMSNLSAEMIQPERLRLPKVIIAAEWVTKADIWNFGCIVSVLVPILKPDVPQYRLGRNRTRPRPPEPNPRISDPFNNDSDVRCKREIPSSKSFVEFRQYFGNAPSPSQRLVPGKLSQYIRLSTKPTQ